MRQLDFAQGALGPGGNPATITLTQVRSSAHNHHPHSDLRDLGPVLQSAISGLSLQLQRVRSNLLTCTLSLRDFNASVNALQERTL